MERTFQPVVCARIRVGVEAVPPDETAQQVGG